MENPSREGPFEPTDGEPTSRLTLGELEVAVRSADPTAFLVLPRILRRVIKQHRQLAGFGLVVPHRKSYVIDGGPLLEIVEKDELGLPDYAVLPEKVILLARPGPGELEETPAGDVLLDCWRLLFHARVHVALEDKPAAKQFTSAMIRERIHRIGTAEFDEVRAVLGQDDLLLPAGGEESVYVEFAATYLELRFFSAGFLPHYFPSLKSLEAVDAVLWEDIDAEELFRATRPAGAPDPRDSFALDEWADMSAEGDLFPIDAFLLDEIPSQSKYRVLMRKSQRPASLGNVVRAAIYHARARRCAPPELAFRAESAVKTDVNRMIQRLRAALEVEQSSPQHWQESLFALVGQTPRGIWTVEARLLYDLQKVCVDHEREVYTVDLVEWAKSFGRRPLKRSLPAQRDVLMLKHLRSAAGRLAVVRISDGLRRQLARLVHDAMERVEARLRRRLRPRIDAALDEVGLKGRNPPEQVARKKLVEELLDHISERGFLTMGDLRDAISRNNLKLPDLAEPLDFLRGDQLLRADRRLALALDGVYRHGEFYMRWMQRLSSLAFGTAAGRFLTRYAAVPFGGAYVALAGVHEVWKMILGVEQSAAEPGFHPASPSVLLLGLLILFLVNSAGFRRAVGRFFTTAYRVFNALAIEPIRWIVQSRLLQQIVHSRPFTISFRFVVKPLVWTVIVWRLVLLDEPSWRMSPGAAVSIFLAFNLLLNSRLGRNAEEVAADWIVQGWHRFGLRAITGLFWFVVDTFRRLLAVIERLMYSVDEFLRFRSGESRTSLIVKAVLGFVWFFVSYVLRFAVTVLIEPQINPLKHFPVVTVSHKLLFGLIPHLRAVFIGLGMEKALALTTATAIITGIPGLFGFLVWELKENWRLYAANRRRQLGPIPIGPHSETMSRLLKPGFHSGTLSKRYAKLRRAERRARAGGSWRAAHRHARAIRHAELSIRRWVQREFLELFAQSKSWPAARIIIDEIRLGTNCVRLTLGSADDAEAPLKLVFEAKSGRLLAGVTASGWIDRLPPDGRRVLAAALIGLYKSAGVEMVRQQIEGEFHVSVPLAEPVRVPLAEPVPPLCYDVTAEGLVVWPDDLSDVEVFYDLREGPWIAPQSVRGLPRRRMPTIERRRIIFDEVPVDWDRWVEAWEHDVSRAGNPLDTSAFSSVLPP
ncbi:MAG: hypothetical protein KKA28_05525 [Planctomycetes bacterium]|nr:hypothetical protein [Planctomycetota bacterium]